MLWSTMLKWLKELWTGQSDPVARLKFVNVKKAHVQVWTINDAVYDLEFVGCIHIAKPGFAMSSVRRVKVTYENCDIEV